MRFCIRCKKLISANNIVWWCRIQWSGHVVRLAGDLAEWMASALFKMSLSKNRTRQTGFAQFVCCCIRWADFVDHLRSWLTHSLCSATTTRNRHDSEEGSNQVYRFHGDLSSSFTVHGLRQQNLPTSSELFKASDPSTGYSLTPSCQPTVLSAISLDIRGFSQLIISSSTAGFPWSCMPSTSHRLNVSGFFARHAKTSSHINSKSLWVSWVMVFTGKKTGLASGFNLSNDPLILATVKCRLSSKKKRLLKIKAGLHDFSIHLVVIGLGDRKQFCICWCGVSRYKRKTKGYCNHCCE